MVYQKKFVAVVKCNGSILRETEENDVFIPFSSEYSILLKNLDTRRSLVRVSIDGDDVMGGSSLIIPANSDFELIGFLKSHKIKNKFKFIKKTDNIIKHRGDNIDDGIIRIEYAFEQSLSYSFHSNSGSNYYTWPTSTGGGITTGQAYYTSSVMDNSIKNCALGNITIGSSSGGAGLGEANSNATASYSITNNIKPEEGITVKGSEVNQNFNSVWFGTEVDKDCIVIRIKGESNESVQIKEPVTIKYRTKCETCGKKHKPNKKFCSECGTSLLIV